MGRNGSNTVVAAAALVAMVCGCTADYHAKEIVEPDTSPGRMWLSMAGSPESLGVDAHRRIDTDEGITIDVWVYKAADRPGSASRGTVILLHEMRESKASWPHRGVATRLAKRGFDAVLMDLRAHGKSTGRFVTHGVREKHDVKTVMDALMGEGLVSEPFVVSGIALGAVVAIQYAAIDDRVHGVVSIGAYKDLRSWTEWMLRLSSEAQRTEAIERAERIAGFSFDDASAIQAVGKIHGPILFAHGIADLTAPQSHSEELHQAAHEPKELMPLTGLTVTVFEDWCADQVERIAEQAAGTN